MKILNKISLFFIWIYQKTFSSHTGILKDILYKEPVCTHFPHCSEYGKQCFQKYDFLTALKYTMERIDNCTPDNKIKYDPSSYKIVYFSSAPIGIPFLEELIKDKRFDVVAVVTMPDAPSWRWQKLKENIIAQKAKELWITHIFKPEKIKDNQEFVEEIKKLDPDFFVVLSYGKIMPKEILDIPRLWPINIHWSILPKYRWASPIQSVFLNWEKETGITIMYMDEKMDTGDIIKIQKFPLWKKDNSKTVIDKFIENWPKFFVDALWDFAKWKLTRKKQNEQKATYCAKFKKEDGHIDFNESAENIYKKFQAFYLWPWIYSFWNWKKITFTDIDFDLDNIDKQIWQVYKNNWQVKIACKQGNTIINKLKLEWKKEMNIEDFINWYKDFVDSILN